MKYSNIVKGTFIKRDNRFIAQVNINGNVEVCHIKNTGRCRELLVEGAEVFLEPSTNPERKTKFSLVVVNKNGRLVNMDSQAPNKVVEEAILNGLIFDNVTYLKREFRYCKSRFDFYMEQGSVKSFIEVKGVTLENNNVVSFPDAPSERAVKHLDELKKSINDGYNAYVLFVVQMSDVDYFVPNAENHKEFADKLKEVSSAGVNILAYDCNVKADELVLRNNKVEVRI